MVFKSSAYLILGYNTPRYSYTLKVWVVWLMRSSYHHFNFIFYIENLYKLKPIYSPSILRLILRLPAFCFPYSLKPSWYRLNKALNKAIR